MIAFPDITHHTAAVAGTVWHQYHDGQSAEPVGLQAAVSFKGLIWRLQLHIIDTCSLLRSSKTDFF